MAFYIEEKRSAKGKWIRSKGPGTTYPTLEAAEAMMCGLGEYGGCGPLRVVDETGKPVSIM